MIRSRFYELCKLRKHPDFMIYVSDKINKFHFFVRFFKHLKVINQTLSFGTFLDLSLGWDIYSQENDSLLKFKLNKVSIIKRIRGGSIRREIITYEGIKREGMKQESICTFL